MDDQACGKVESVVVARGNGHGGIYIHAIRGEKSTDSSNCNYNQKMVCNY